MDAHTREYGGVVVLAGAAKVSSCLGRRVKGCEVSRCEWRGCVAEIQRNNLFSMRLDCWTMLNRRRRCQGFAKRLIVLW